MFMRSAYKSNFGHGRPELAIILHRRGEPTPTDLGLEIETNDFFRILFRQFWCEFDSQDFTTHFPDLSICWIRLAVERQHQCRNGQRSEL